MTMALLQRGRLEDLTSREYVETSSPIRGERGAFTEEEEKNWTDPALRALDKLLSLPENWDTYGAPRISPAYAKAVLAFLELIMLKRTPLPSFVPTSRGGIQLEWHTANIDVEVEFVTPTRVEGLYADLQSGQTWEGDLSYDLTPLVGAIVLLTLESGD